MNQMNQMSQMNQINKIVRQFEPCYIGNDWGNYIDIENFKYDLHSMQPQLLVKKTEVHSYHIDIKNNNNNNNNKKQEDKIITSLIIKVSSTTFITLFFTYFVYKII
jgi:hypothetical protein